MKKVIVGCAVVVFCATGCLSSFISNALVPNNTNKVRQNVLEYNKEVNSKSTDALLSLSKQNLEDDSAFKWLDRINDRANKGGKVGIFEQGMKQVIGNTARQDLEPMVGKGLAFLQENALPLIASLTGIGALGGGLGARSMRRRGQKIRDKETLNKMWADQADDSTKARMRENVKYTPFEKEIV
jgi:hypothetical protein